MREFLIVSVVFSVLFILAVVSNESDRVRINNRVRINVLRDELNKATQENMHLKAKVKRLQKEVEHWKQDAIIVYVPTKPELVE